MILLAKLDDAFFDAFSKLLPLPLERVLSARLNMKISFGEAFSF